MFNPVLWRHAENVRSHLCLINFRYIYLKLAVASQNLGRMIREVSVWPVTPCGGARNHISSGSRVHSLPLPYRSRPCCRGVHFPGLDLSLPSRYQNGLLARLTWLIVPLQRSFDKRGLFWLLLLFMRKVKFVFFSISVRRRAAQSAKGSATITYRHHSLSDVFLPWT